MIAGTTSSPARGSDGVVRTMVPPLSEAEAKAAFAPVAISRAEPREGLMAVRAGARQDDIAPSRTALGGDDAMRATADPASAPEMVPADVPTTSSAAESAPVPVLPSTTSFNAAELAAAEARVDVVVVETTIADPPVERDATAGPLAGEEQGKASNPAAAMEAVAPPAATAGPQTSSTAAAAAPAGAPAAVGVAPASAAAAELAARFTAAPKNSLLAAIASFYALRGNQPVWTQDGALTSYARAGLERLARADEDGLDHRQFQAPAVEALAAGGGEPAMIADAEIAISTAFLTYARQAANGRVDARAVSRSIVPSTNFVDPAMTLASIAIAADPAAVLDGFNPTHPQFVALKKKLAELRAEDAAVAESQPPRVPPGPVLKVGVADARVALLRSRLGLTMVDGDVYDDALAEAVRSFQKERRLKPTGTVGPQTIAALNGGLQRSRVSIEDEIVSNMERWRWLPHDIGSSNVLVNVPEYRLRVTLDGEPVHEAKVIVGKPGTPTPIFSDTMEFVVFNPSWNVPQSIIQKEYLPKLMEDPDYLAKRGFVVTYRGNQMTVRQPPGDDNALGHIKFMFPNNFSVYLHDTSSRNLFASEKRAFSHGCVRVDAPYKFAEIVMGAQNGWTEDKVRASIGGRERRVDLKRKLPVHIAYFTAYVDDFGELKLFDDIYGYDRQVLAALGLQG